MKKPVEFVNGSDGRYMMITNKRGTIFYIKIDPADESYLKDFDWYVNCGVPFAWFPNYRMSLRNVLAQRELAAGR